MTEGPRFDDLDVYNSPADLPANPYREGWLEVVLNPPSLYIYTSASGHQLVAASTPTTPATPASEGGQGVVELATEAEVQAGTAGILVATVARLKAELDRRGGIAATESALGPVELATEAEVQAGTAGALVATVARLKAEFDRRVPSASQTVAGTVELATAAETSAGTDNTRAVHPAGFKSAITPEAWIAPTLLNSWVNFGGTEQVAGYRKTPWGEVQLRGTLKNGTTTTGTVLFNLPAGYRPAAERRFVSLGGQDTAACRIEVTSGGNVIIGGVTANTYLPLESVRFDV